MNTQEKLAEIDGWTDVKQPDSHPYLTAGKPPKGHKHDKFAIHTIPDYNDPGVMLAMLERWQQNTQKGNNRTWDLTYTGFYILDLFDWLERVPSSEKQYVGRAPTFVEAAQQALLKASEK